MAFRLGKSKFDQLVLDYLPAAHRFAIRLTGNIHDAEDIMQEALLRASRGRRNFRGQSKFSTWLFRIVINTFRDHLGKSASQEEITKEVADKKTLDPFLYVANKEVGEVVAQAVSSLPERQREVIVLKLYEGFETGEVAEILGISEQNVRTNLHYARQELRKLLAPFLNEGKT